MAIITHQFNHENINQTETDIYIQNFFVPLGYCNATQMCKANGKKWFDYKRQKGTTSYLLSLSRSEGIHADLIIEILTGSNEERGTWVHPDVAIHLAMWIDSDFAVWAIRVLRAALDGNLKALNAETQKALDEYKEAFEKLRSATKETFWFMSDAIQAYYTSNPRHEIYPGQNYAEAFDTLNEGLFGKRAKQIKEELGISKNKLNRDHFGRESLKRIEMVQRIAEVQVSHWGLPPCQAIQKAVVEMNYSPIHFSE